MLVFQFTHWNLYFYIRNWWFVMRSGNLVLVTRRFTLFKIRFDFPEKIIANSIRFRKTKARVACVRHGGMRAHQRREWAPAAPVRPCSTLSPRILYQWVLDVINFNIFKCEWKKNSIRVIITIVNISAIISVLGSGK